MLINEMSNQGHVYSPQQTLITRASELLDLPVEFIPPAIERLSKDDRIRLDNFDLGGLLSGNKNVLHEQTAIYLTPFYYGETGVAEQLFALAQLGPKREVWNSIAAFQAWMFSRLSKIACPPNNVRLSLPASILL